MWQAMNKRVTGKLIWQGAMAIIATAGVLSGTSAYATDPEHSVSISPKDIVWSDNNVTDVWPVGDTLRLIRYEAICNPCTGTHECHFTERQGLSDATDYSDATARIEGVKTDSCCLTITAGCPGNDSHGTASRQFKAVKLQHLLINGQPVDGTTQYFEKSATGSVTITAQLSFDVQASELRQGFLYWADSPGCQGSTQLEWSVPLSQTGVKDIYAVVDCCKFVHLCVYEVTESAVYNNPGDSRRLWYFNGFGGVPNYNNYITLSAEGLPTGGSYVWTVTAGTDYVELGGIGGPIGDSYGYDEPYVYATGASLVPNDVTVQLTFNGKDLCSHNLTVYSPHSVVPTPSGSINADWPPNPTGENPLDGNSSNGYTSWYYWLVEDMFGTPLPRNVPGTESVADWENDQDNNWNMGTAGNGAIAMGTDGVSTFRDNYSFSGSAEPSCMHAWEQDGQGQLYHPTGWDTDVKHTLQSYRVGSSLAGIGTIVKQQTAQFRRGSGRAY